LHPRLHRVLAAGAWAPGAAFAATRRCARSISICLAGTNPESAPASPSPATRSSGPGSSVASAPPSTQPAPSGWGWTGRGGGGTRDRPVARVRGWSWA